MKKPGVLVVAGEGKPSREVCALLTDLDYAATPIHSLRDLAEELQKAPEVAVILDLDSIQVDHQFLRELRKRSPQLHLLGISELSYHPGLEEIIGSHLLACLTKPLDVEELCFWLRSIGEHLTNPEETTAG